MSTVNILHYFGMGLPNSDYLPKLLLLKVTGGSFQGSKIQTTCSNRLEYGLKWFQGSTLDDPLCQKSILSQNFGIGAPKFGLTAENAAPKSGGPIFSSL